MYCHTHVYPSDLHDDHNRFPELPMEAVVLLIAGQPQLPLHETPL